MRSPVLKVLLIAILGNNPAFGRPVSCPSSKHAPRAEFRRSHEQPAPLQKERPLEAPSLKFRPDDRRLGTGDSEVTFE